MKAIRFLTVGILLAAASIYAGAQELKLPKCAIMPGIFIEKDDPCTNETAMGKVMAAINADLTKAGIEPMPPANAKSVYQTLVGKNAYDTLPTPAELLLIGQHLKAKYAMAFKLRWDISSKWVGLGPKTKAFAAVDMLVIDTDKQEIVLNVKGVKADSTKIEKGWETAAALLVNWGTTLFSGGPKTPHMERSGVVAVIKAMDPWIHPQPEQSKKIVLDAAQAEKSKTK